MLASLILVGGSLGDRLGRKKMYAGGILLFTAASIFCGVPPPSVFSSPEGSRRGSGARSWSPGASR
jgi:MFS family permease